MTDEVRLAAVQMAWRPADYQSEAVFADRVRRLALRAVEGARGPALVAFPELVGLPLLATVAGVADELERGLPQALATWARRHPARLALAARRHRVGPLRAAYAALGPAAFRAYHDAFAAAARAAGATVVAGSAFLPTVTYEPARGWHVVDARPRNVSFTFAPNGALIGRSAKAYLTEGLERRVGLVTGRVEDLSVIATPVGRVAVAVCLDGFYHHVLERFDGLAADVVVQPSANDARWDRPWPPDPSRREGDVWLSDGLRAGLQGRAHLRYGVNPMMVGDLPPLAPRGCSTIVRRVAADASSDHEATLPWGAGVLAIAPDAETEAVVSVDVPHPGRLEATSSCAGRASGRPW